MTLIQCAECNRDVSDRASACPHCGNPIQQKSEVLPEKVTLGKTTRDLLLQKDLGQVAGMADSVSGKLGGAFSGILGKISGAGMGAEWAANRMMTAEYSAELFFPTSLKNAVNNARLILANIGRPVDLPSSPESPVLVAIIKGGFLNMNPAVVVLEFEAVEQNQTRMVLSASAKEGWIKQKTAEKVVARLIPLLEGAVLS